MNDLIVQIIPSAIAILVALFTIYFETRHSKRSIARERLDNVYYKLYVSIEPHLFKDIDSDQLAEFVELFNDLDKKFFILISPRLREYVEILSKQKGRYYSTKDTKDSWFTVCSVLSKEYDELCKLSHIPLRKPAYRINHGQYESKFELFFLLTEFLLPALILCSVPLVYYSFYFIYLTIFLYLLYILRKIHY